VSSGASGDPKTDPGGNSGGPEKNRIAWHPAFFEAIRLELEPYRDRLEFMSEYPLTAEPLRVDVLIIKKPGDLVITKNIAAIFRGVNIVEYKSPGDYVSVEDFYKVYGYACLYVSLNKVPITDVTLSFVGSRYPRSLVSHLGGIRNFSVEERDRGIYTVEGDIIPIQIIENRRLSAEENGWLKDLDRELSPGELLRLSAAVDRLGKAAFLRAYLDAVFRANPGSIQEVLRMSDAALTLEQVFEEAGLIDKWEARGEAQGFLRGEARGFIRGEAQGEAQGFIRGEAQGFIRGEAQSRSEVARKLIAMGLTLEQIAEATGLDSETLKKL
jgi:hypothetical protein